MLNKISKRTKIILIGILALIAIFTISYVGTGTYLDKKAQAQTDRAKEEEDKIALKKDSNLDNGIKLQYYTGENLDKELTVSGLKKELKKEALSYDELKELATKQGYELKNKGESIIAFAKSNEKALDEGKYYLGFQENKLAIFVCKDGKLVFDSYTERERAKNEVSGGAEVIKKIENHQIKADTKEDIQDKAMDYTS